MKIIKQPSQRLLSAGRRATLLVVGLACLGVSELHSQAVPTSCSKADLALQPYWISSAAWVDDLKEIAVVDTLRNKVLLYSPDGKSSLPELSKSSGFLPASLLKTEDGFLLKLVGSSILRLDENLEQERPAIDLSKASNPVRKGSVRSIYQWTSAGNQIVAYGSIGTGKEEDPYQLGFFRAPLDKPYAEYLEPLADGDYYVLGFPYLASIGKTAYFLRMEEGREPALYAVPPGRKPQLLSALSKSYGAAVPTIRSEMAGPESAEALYQELEGYSFPVGLYAQGTNLYLLTRKPEGGATIWSLFQINPKTGQLATTELRLPTQANHLTVVPGPEKWFLFEKGPVLSPGRHEIKSMLAIPSAWISSPGAPWLNPQSKQFVSQCQ